MFAGGEESRSDLFEASVASVAFVVRDPCPGVGQVPRSFWFRGTRQIGEQTSHGETVKFRYRSTESFLVREFRYRSTESFLAGGSTGAEKRVFAILLAKTMLYVNVPLPVCLFVL